MGETFARDGDEVGSLKVAWHGRVVGSTEHLCNEGIAQRRIGAPGALNKRSPRPRRTQRVVRAGVKKPVNLLLSGLLHGLTQESLAGAVGHSRDHDVSAAPRPWHDSYFDSLHYRVPKLVERIFHTPAKTAGL